MSFEPKPRGLSAMDKEARSHFIGGSEARIIMGESIEDLLSLWREKRGEAEHPSTEDELLPQLGYVTEDLNVEWCARRLSLSIVSQQEVFIGEEKFMAARTDAIAMDGNEKVVVEAKYMLPWNWSREAATKKYYAQLQHNMICAGLENSILSVITGDGKWNGIWVRRDPMYELALIEAEREFWRCVETGDTPQITSGASLIDMKPAGVIDMERGNRALEWQDAAVAYLATIEGAKKHKDAEGVIKELMPPDCAEAFGAGVRCKRGADGRLRVSEIKKARNKKS